MDVEFLRYQYRDRHDGVITTNKFKMGVRHLQVVYMFLCSVAMGAVRGSVGVAVLAINDAERRNDTYIQIHEWDKAIQGIILSAFFFGYALALVPADLILKNIGGKAVTTVILAVNGFLCLAIPAIVNRGGWIATSNALFMLGITQACLTPANSNLMKQWIPPNEYNMCSILVYAGIPIGITIAMPTAGILAEANLGWELIFYSLAMLTLSFGIICGVLTANSPDTHPAVGDAEKEYIHNALSLLKKRPVQIPWKAVLKTRQFWAVTCAHAASSAIYAYYLVDVPAYLRSLNLPIRDCAFYTMLAFIVMWTSYLASSSTCDWLHDVSFVGYFMHTCNYRKLINAIGAFIAVIGLTLLPNLAGWSYVTIVALTATLGAVGFQFSGFVKSLRDMSENFSGTLLLMTSSIASVAGALTPLATGFVIGNDEYATKKWRIAFLLLASLCLVCNLTYTIVGSGDKQKWDMDKSKHKFGYHNVTNHLELEENELSKSLQLKNVSKLEILQ